MQICRNFNHYISVPSLNGIVLEMKIRYIFLVFSDPLFALVPLSMVVALFGVNIPGLRTAKIHRIPLGSLIGYQKEKMPIIALTSVILDPRSFRFGIVIFYMAKKNPRFDYYLYSWHTWPDILLKNTIQWVSKIKTFSIFKNKFEIVTWPWHPFIFFLLPWYEGRVIFCYFV